MGAQRHSILIFFSGRFGEGLLSGCMVEIVLLILGGGVLGLTGWWLSKFLPHAYPPRKEPLRNEIDELKTELESLKAQVSDLALRNGLMPTR